MRQEKRDKPLEQYPPILRGKGVWLAEEQAPLTGKNPFYTHWIPHLERLISILCWLLILFLGGYQAWLFRYTMNYYDGISYLDLKDAFLQGRWREVFNSYWNPLYPGLLALGFWLLKPSPEKEFPTLHLINFGIYIFSLICFEFFLRQLLRYLQKESPPPSSKRQILFRVIVYTLFLYFSLLFQRVYLETPDMCLAGLIYLVGGLFLRIRLREKEVISPFLLGLVIGTGYLTKSAMLLLGLLMILTAGIILPPTQRFRQMASLLSGYLLVICPYILALSLVKGEFTVGQTGSMNYLWYVNRLRFYTYQSDYPVKGKPLHPLRQILDHPPIYEYGTPIKGTYPRWYDPTYWFEGIQPQWNSQAQLMALERNLLRCARIFLYGLSEILITFSLCYLLSSNKFVLKRKIKALWFLLLPTLLAIALYSLVVVERRYIGAFLLLSGAALFSSLAFAQYSPGRKRLAYISLGWMVFLLILKTYFTLVDNSFYAQKLFQGLTYQRVAHYLKQIGIQPGDKVACIGYGNWENHVFWARLARVRLVAEAPASNINGFWSLYARRKGRIIATFRKTGAKVLVVQSTPNWALSDGWQKIPGTNYFFYRLR